MISGLKRRSYCEICGTQVRGIGTYCQTCRDDLNSFQVSARRRKASGYVYAIGVKGDENSVIKFGYTRNIEDRFKTLQIGSPVLLELLGKADGRIHLEQKLHRLLAASRSHGEWFTRTDEVKKALECIKANTLVEWLAEGSSRARVIKHLQEQTNVL